MKYLVLLTASLLSIIFSLVILLDLRRGRDGIRQVDLRLRSFCVLV